MEEISEQEIRIFERRELLEERLKLLNGRKRRIREIVRNEEIEIRRENDNNYVRETRLGGEYIVKAERVIFNINNRISSIYKKLSELSAEQRNIDPAKYYFRLP